MRVLLIKSPKTAGLECFVARGRVVQLAPRRPDYYVRIIVIHQEGFYCPRDLQLKVRLMADDGDSDIADAERQDARTRSIYALDLVLPHGRSPRAGHHGRS